MTPSDRDLPILIIGAGIRGLTAALALQNSVPLLLRGLIVVIFGSFMSILDQTVINNAL